MTPRGSVLEVGPGQGNHTRYIATGRRRVTAGDISPVQLAAHRDTLAGTSAERCVASRVILDVADLPFLDDSFDTTLALGGPVSYVLDRGRGAVADLMRVTRPGGHIIFSVMTPGWITSPHMAYDHPDDMLAAGEVNPADESFVGHRYRCYTWERLRSIIPHGCTVIDHLASHVDGVSSRTSLAAYMELARESSLCDTTRGYLLVVLRKP